MPFLHLAQNQQVGLLKKNRNIFNPLVTSSRLHTLSPRSLIALSYLFDNGNLADAPFDHAFDRHFEVCRPAQCVLNYCGVYGVTPNRLFQLLGFNAKSSATEEKSLVKVSRESYKPLSRYR